MKRNLHLLMIDPQNDFCDLPENYRPLDPVSRQPLAPALPVPGAHQDMLRLAALINRGRAGLSAISLTLDSHHRFDIAHPPSGLPPTASRSRHSPKSPPPTCAPEHAAPSGRLPLTLNYLDQLEAAGATS
jgi:hypothetical protein